jgi:hypothetical protein
MQFTYTDPDETTIKVTLDEGETWSDLTGPTEAFVPTDEGNRNYQDYKTWLDEGNEPATYTPPSIGEK